MCVGPQTKQAPAMTSIFYWSIFYFQDFPVWQESPAKLLFGRRPGLNPIYWPHFSKWQRSIILLYFSWLPLNIIFKTVMKATSSSCICYTHKVWQKSSLVSLIWQVKASEENTMNPENCCICCHIQHMVCSNSHSLLLFDRWEKEPLRDFNSISPTSSGIYLKVKRWSCPD